MDVGSEMGPTVAPDGVSLIEMAADLRHGCLVAMVQCSAWLSLHGLGFADFKLENMINVGGHPKCKCELFTYVNCASYRRSPKKPCLYNMYII